MDTQKTTEERSATQPVPSSAQVKATVYLHATEGARLELRTLETSFGPFISIWCEDLTFSLPGYGSAAARHARALAKELLVAADALDQQTGGVQ